MSTTITITGSGTSDPAAIGRLRGMTDHDLRAELSRALTLSAENLVYLAVVWSELERRGEDLSDLRHGLGAYLPLIAASQLAAEAVVQFVSQPAVLRSIATLPLDEQRRLAAGKTVRTLAVNADGNYEEQDIAATQLTAAQARLVFDAGRIRRPTEQLKLVSDVLAAKRRQTKGGPRRKIRIEKGTGRIRIGNMTFAPGEFVEVLGELFLDPDEPSAAERTKQVMIGLSDAEHRALKRNAAESGMNIQTMVRTALRSTGLLRANE